MKKTLLCIALSLIILCPLIILPIALSNNSAGMGQVLVTYKISESTVYTQRVNKDSRIGELFVFESDNHQTYCSEWKDVYGNIYSNESIISSNILLFGEAKSSLLLFTTDENEYVFINGTNHVHSDGKVVILNDYYNKVPKIGVSAFSNNSGIKDIYLPSSLYQICSNNFIDCPNLKNIYFAGDEGSWNSVIKESSIPEEVELHFSTSF